MKVLFIGRFQPFHLGHLQVIRSCLDQYKFCYIGIGSSQYSNTSQNPFSFEERKTMISQSLHDEKITQFKVVQIPDINDPPNWVEHVRSIIDDFDMVFTNNDFTEQLFIAQGYQVDHPGFYMKYTYSGKEIRSRMIQHKSWKDLVHPKVYSYLISINAEERVRTL